MRTVLPARSDPQAAIARIAAFVASVPSDAHSAAALERARLALLDTIGCAIQGATTENARRTCEAIVSWGSGPAPVLGTGLKVPPPWAALANGVAAHAKDLDDYTLVANDHASAVLVPAILAVGADCPCTYGDILDAYLTGLEVIFRVGKAVNMGHYKLGWHTTSTIDGLGAAAAVSRLKGLDSDRVASALSLTVSMGAGMTSQFGTSAKPLHAGLSAKAGVLAATLAECGLTGNPAVLDGPVSFASLMVPEGEADFEAALSNLGQTWGIETYGLGAKVYPSCGYTHRSVDAALALHGAMSSDDRANIQSVRVSIPDFHLAILPYDVPNHPDEALFSTAWCVATALLKGHNRLEDFSANALSEPELRGLTQRVAVHGRRTKRPEINVDPDDPDTVEVTLSDGRVLTQSCGVWTGMPGADLDKARFVEKFRACVDAAYPGTNGELAVIPQRILEDAPDTFFEELLASITDATPTLPNN